MLPAVLITASPALWQYSAQLARSTSTPCSWPQVGARRAAADHCDRHVEAVGVPSMADAARPSRAAAGGREDMRSTLQPAQVQQRYERV
jgi:hypothetical protein